MALHEVDGRVERAAGEGGHQQLALSRCGIPREDMEAVVRRGPRLHQALRGARERVAVPLVVVEGSAERARVERAEPLIALGENRVGAIIAIRKEGPIVVVGNPWHSRNGEDVGTDHVVTNPAGMVQLQLIERIDELRMDMQGTSEVEDQFDLPFSTMPSSRARTARTRTRSRRRST